jgi:hypothetical protein
MAPVHKSIAVSSWCWEYDPLSQEPYKPGLPRLDIQVLEEPMIFFSPRIFIRCYYYQKLIFSLINILVLHLFQWWPRHVCALHWDWSMDRIFRLRGCWFLETVDCQWTSRWVYFAWTNNNVSALFSPGHWIILPLFTNAVVFDFLINFDYSYIFNFYNFNFLIKCMVLKSQRRQTIENGGEYIIYRIWLHWQWMRSFLSWSCSTKMILWPFLISMYVCFSRKHKIKETWLTSFSLFYSSRYTQGYENGLTFATIKVNSVPSSCVYQSVIIAQIIMNNTILACASETIRVIWIHHYIMCLPFNYIAVSFRTGCWTHGSWVQTSASIRFLQPLACWF